MKDFKSKFSIYAALAAVCVLLAAPLAHATASGIVFSSVTHNFGSVAAGGSEAYGVKLTNKSASAFPFALTLSGASSFTYGSNCGISVAAGAHCEIVFTYKPTSSGAQSAVWCLAANGRTFQPSNGGTLSATGVSAPGFTVTTSEHDFGTQPMTTTSGLFGVVLANSTSNSIALTINTTPANHKIFPLTQNSCGATLAAHATCNLAWDFAPKAAGFISSAYAISGVDSTTNEDVILTTGGAQVSGVALEGTGINSTGVTLSTAGHAFGNQGVNTTSKPYGAELTNATASPISLSYTSTGNSSSFPFKSNGCGVTLAADASCELIFTFDPQADGSMELTYGITATSSGNPVTIKSNSSAVAGVELTGTGVTGTLDLRTAGHNFGPWVTNTTSPNYLTILTNTTDAAIDLSFAYSANSDEADFTQTNNSCGATLLAGAKCSLQWEFSPTTTGALTTTYEITAKDTTDGNPITVTSSGVATEGVKLVGNGQATGGLTLASAGHNFGEQGVGGGSATYGTVLYNTTGQSVALTYGFSNAAAAQNFATVDNNCGATLATNTSCNLQWQFMPTTTGSLSVTYDLTATEGGTPITITSGGTPVSGVALSGTGVQ